MNITADPGLPYTISHNYFTILNITKNKHLLFGPETTLKSIKKEKMINVSSFL